MADGVHYLDAKGPDGIRLYAIGDVHGRLDLLREMHGIIGEEIVRDGVADWRIIHLGDYVDRGPDSRGVIEFLASAAKADPRNLAVAGNHDVGFLEFLGQPDSDGLFARFGGRETAQSYGVDLDFHDPATFAKRCALLTRAVPRGHVAFLEDLPFWFSFGDFFFCHAGVRPDVPLERQEPRDLIWIRDTFHRHSGLYEKVIVHGHTPVHEAEVMANRVNVDTGAVFSGTLTALVVDGADKRILQVGSTEQF